MFQESNKKKGQISIEFMIVFAFILVVFLFLFALITQQRAITQNSQTFSQLQLVAQTIALQINRAAQAGTGFSAQLPITTSIGNIPYNVSVTKGGLVIIAATSGTQIMRATAYSNVQSVSSSASFYGIGNTLYVLPIANGTISLQNSFGTICIDYQCPTNANVSASVSLSTQTVHAANFDGVSSYIDANNGITPGTTTFSAAVWISPTGTIPSFPTIVSTTNSGYTLQTCAAGLGNPTYVTFWINNQGDGNTCTAQTQISYNNWYFFVLTYDGTTAKLYKNGTLVYSQSFSVTLNPSNTLRIGGYPGIGNRWNGKIANVQIYSQVLTAQQIMQLYQGGISATPISNSGLNAWYPLNGDPNDYGGNGKNGVITGSIIFTSVAQLFATVGNPLGQAVNNLLVGFTTTAGNLTNGNGGPGQVVSTYTNSNGIASVFLNQQGNNGQAFVQVTAFNSNALPSSLLAAWYPLNLGQGSVAQDISGNKNNGAFGGQPWWSLQNYYAQFPSSQAPLSLGVSGQTGYVEQKTGFVFMDNAAQSFTISLWVRPNATSGVILSELGQTAPNTNWHDSWLELVNGNVYMRIWALGCQLLGKINTNTWTNVAMTYNGAVLTGYINGASTNTISYTRQVPAGGTTAMFYPLGTPDLTNCGSGLSYSGGIANYQFYSNSLSQIQIASLYAAGLSSSPISGQNAQLWYPLNGDTNDYSGNSYNASMYGSTSFAPLAASISKQQLSSGNIGKILTPSFNGASSYIKVGNVTKINSISNWSVSFWMNSTATTNYKNSLDANFVPAANNAGPRFEQGGSGGSNSLNLIVGTSAGNYNVYTYSNVIGQKVWYNVVSSRNGNTITGYLNGVLVFNASNTKWPSGFANLTLGRGFANSADRWFSGNLSNIQIYNQTISAQQALQIYQGGIAGVPLPSTRLAGWLPLNGNANNYSIGSGINSISSTNVAYNSVLNYVPYLLKASNYSGINFNGQNSYLSVNSIQTISGSRSVVAWIYVPRAYGGMGSPIFSSGLSGAADFFAVTGANGAACSGKLKIYIDHWGTQCNLSSRTVNPGSWNQVAYSYNSSSSSIKLYINGQDAGCTTGSCSTMYGYTMNAVQIGGNTAGGSTTNSSFYGGISSLQLYATALSASQIQQLYNLQIPPSVSTTVPLSWSP
ncbi:MAG: hypothetical protein KGH53_00330 [Candidatus Micrarchaeota archaeon]|nr:hypothetical protein [Candidatus Micrarchaeota archaeon]